MGWEPPSCEAGSGVSVGSWSQGGPSAEAVASEAWPSEEAMERRTRRIHYGRTCGNEAITGCSLSGLPFDFACA